VIALGTWNKGMKLPGDGANTWAEEKSVFLGGSDPTLSGTEAAHRPSRQGSLPPKLSSRVPRSVAGRVAGELLEKIAGKSAKENAPWH